MANKSKEVSSAVKIDPALLVKVDEFIKKDENRLRFSNKKQFIDLAVYEYLEKTSKEAKR
jgi:hypothetical protein